MTGENEAPESSIRTRAARAAALVSGIAGLAGCSNSDDGSTDASGTRSGTPPRDRPSGSQRSLGTDETSNSDVSNNALTGSGTRTASCSDRAESIRDELFFLETQISNEERRLRRERLRYALAKARRSWLPGGFDQETLERAATVADRLADSVVGLYGIGEEQADSAPPWSNIGVPSTAWFRHPNIIVTNAHVAHALFQGAGADFIADNRLANPEDTPPVRGVTRSGDQFTAEFVTWQQVGTDSVDVAVFRTEYEGTPVSGGSTMELTPGQPLVMVGHPAWFGTWTPTLGRYLWDGTEDEVPLDLPAPSDHSFHTSIPSIGGSSGSPIVTLDGDLVGIHYSGADDNGTGDVDYEFDDSWQSFVYDRPLSIRGFYEEHTVEIIDEMIEANT